MDLSGWEPQNQMSAAERWFLRFFFRVAMHGVGDRRRVVHDASVAFLRHARDVYRIDTLV